MTYPFGKLASVWNGGREEHIVDIIRQKYDGFFPYNATL